jgi:3-deoxy-D-manno-octulosonic acid kinase
MANIQEKTLGSKIVLFDAEYFPAPDIRMFSGQYWAENKQIIGQAHGRGTTYFFVYQQQEFVLRHYLRGGLIGKVLKDQYWFSGLSRTRPWQEFHLLKYMRAKALPCPIPVAALVAKHGMTYRGDIILSKIPGAQDVFTLLLKASLGADVWQNIGQVIQRFHQHQVYHHDLNIHNIMLDEQSKPWLIDFDKCEIRQGDKWKAANLARLYRSLQKELAAKHIHWCDADWQSLRKGYQC